MIMKKVTYEKIMGMLAASLTFVVLLWTLFSTPSMSVIADGSYPSLADELALSYYNPAEFPVGEVVEQFAYQEEAYSTLLLAAKSSSAVAVAIVRLFTKPFGIDFNTRYLAIVYAVFISCGTYMLVFALERKKRNLGIVGLLATLFIVSNSTAMAYLNSIYPIGAAIAFLLLFLSATTFVFCSKERAGVKYVLLLMLTGQLFLRSISQAIVFFPIVVLVVVLASKHTLSNNRQKALHYFLVILCGWMSVVGVFTGFSADSRVNSTATDYMTVFQGYLPASDDVTEALNQMHLPQEFAEDVGKSYYDQADTFTMNPMSEDVAIVLEENINLRKRIPFIVKNPEIIKKMMDRSADYTQNENNWYVVNEEGDINQHKFSVFSIVDILYPNGYSQGIGGLLVGLFFTGLMLPFFWKQKGIRRWCVIMLAFFATAMLYIPCCTMLTGITDLIILKVLLFTSGRIGLFVGMINCIVVLQGLYRWLSKTDAQLAFPTIQMSEKLPTNCINVTWLDEKKLVWITAMLCCVLFCWQMLPANHVAGVNNGDYGRMMEQIDLWWMPEQLEDESTQASAYVVENYTFREPFHPLRLTSLDPTYSLLFPSILVRAWSLLTNTVYSTYVQAILLYIFASAMMILLARDLYKCMGKIAIVPTLLCICIFFGESQIAWYNSLFGESVIPGSLLAIITCSVHLIRMNRADKKSWLWLLLLAAAFRMLCGSKAQMALGIPAALILFIPLAWYHHPKLVGKLVCYVITFGVIISLVCYDAIGIYVKNQGVSEKHTIWQSVFYGLLLIVDEPEETMNELQIPLEMKSDIGKNAYLPEDQYVYPVTSQEAEEKFYSKVSTMAVVRYYLLHPKYFLRMLDYAATKSIDLPTGFMEYTGKNYVPDCDLYRFNLWRNLRTLFAGRNFISYVIGYAAHLGASFLYWKKGKNPKKKFFILLSLAIMLVGVFQYPLSVLGNGFADNNKQMYTFMICHDLLVVFDVTMLLDKVIKKDKIIRNERWCEER